MHGLFSVILSRSREGAAVSKDLAAHSFCAVIPPHASAVSAPAAGARSFAMLRMTVVIGLLLSGCVNVSMTCPDKVSTVSYKGLSLTGTTSVSCMPALNGGYDIEVGGTNLLALAAAVAPLVAAKQPAAASAPSPYPLPQQSGRGAGEPQLEPAPSSPSFNF